MTTGPDSDLILAINGKRIKQVDEFVYLGHKLLANNNGLAAVKHRIGLGWKAFEKTRNYLHQKEHHIKN